MLATSLVQRKPSGADSVASLQGPSERAESGGLYMSFRYVLTLWKQRADAQESNSKAGAKLGNQ